MIKANIFFLITILGLQLLAPNIVHSEELYREFTADNYNSKEFKVSQRDIKHGNINIRIIQAKKLIHFTDSPHHCRAWFDVVKSKKMFFNDTMMILDQLGFLLDCLYQKYSRRHLIMPLLKMVIMTEDCF